MDFNITKYHCGTDEIQEVELTLKLTTHEWYELKNQGVLELPKDLLTEEESTPRKKLRQEGARKKAIPRYIIEFFRHVRSRAF